MSGRPAGSGPAAPATAAAGHVPANGRRLAARVVDFLAVLALVLAAQLVILGAIHVGGPVGLVVEIVGWLVVAAVLIGYEPFATLRWAATPGKRLFGLRIVALDGGPLRPGAAWVRFLVGGALAFIPFGVVVYGVSVVLGRDRRSLADKAAMTRVVQVPTGPR